MPANTDPLIRKLESIGDLSDEEKRAISNLPMRVSEVGGNEDVVCEGDVPSECCLLINGFMFRYKVLANGARQIISLHISGDIPDLQSFHIKRMDHSLATLIPSKVGYIAHSTLDKLVRDFPSIGTLFWQDTLIDAAIFREWIVNVGQRPALGRLAHLLCEMIVRLRAVGLVTDHMYQLPLMQTDLADALGISTVHTNRMLQELRSDGLIEFQGHRLTILDWPGLKEAAMFDPAYLHLRDPEIAA
jgi:CRP-like cAMP-binding protein